MPLAGGAGHTFHQPRDTTTRVWLTDCFRVVFPANEGRQQVTNDGRGGHRLLLLFIASGRPRPRKHPSGGPPDLTKPCVCHQHPSAATRIPLASVARTAVRPAVAEPPLVDTALQPDEVPNAGARRAGMGSTNACSSDIRAPASTLRFAIGSQTLPLWLRKAAQAQLLTVAAQLVLAQFGMSPAMAQRRRSFDVDQGGTHPTPQSLLKDRTRARIWKWGKAER
jgi:hypothetical protein